MATDKVPGTFFSTGGELEALFQAAVGFVGGDDEVLFDGACSSLLFEGTLLFVEYPYIRNNETSPDYCFLDGVPNRVLRIMELDGQPPTRPQQAKVLLHAGSHNLQILSDTFVLPVANNPFWGFSCKSSQPSLKKEAELRILDVSSKWRIYKDVISHILIRIKPGRRLRAYDPSI